MKEIVNIISKVKTASIQEADNVTDRVIRVLKKESIGYSDLRRFFKELCRADILGYPVDTKTGSKLDDLNKYIKRENIDKWTIVFDRVITKIKKIYKF